MMVTRKGFGKIKKGVWYEMKQLAKSLLWAPGLGGDCVAMTVVLLRNYVLRLTLSQYTVN